MRSSTTTMRVVRGISQSLCIVLSLLVTGSIPVTSTNHPKINRLRKPFFPFGQLSNFGKNNDSKSITIAIRSSECRHI
jgi:hypothetical protein